MGRGGLWRNGDETTLLLVDAVGDNYFDMLGVKPLLGQLPDAKHDYSADSEPPLVLTYWLWRERMGGRADVIGQRMEFRDRLWRIAAVLPPQFRGLSAMGQRHVWIPLSSWARYFREDLERGNGQFEAVARLRPGVSIEQAQAQLDPLAKRIEAGDSTVPKAGGWWPTSIERGMRDRLRPAMIVMAVVVLVLLVACANVAAVLLAYAEARRREIGLRLSLGAGRFALLRQFLAESAVLALAGAGGGLLLANWLLSLVPALAPPSPVPLNFDFRMDTAGAAVHSGLRPGHLAVFGLAPLGYASRVSLAGRHLGVADARAGPRALFSGYSLVTGQVALSVVLVGGAVELSAHLADARESTRIRHLASARAGFGQRRTATDQAGQHAIPRSRGPHGGGGWRRGGDVRAPPAAGRFGRGSDAPGDPGRSAAGRCAAADLLQPGGAEVFRSDRRADDFRPGLRRFRPQWRRSGGDRQCRGGAPVLAGAESARQDSADGEAGVPGGRHRGRRPHLLAPRKPGAGRLPARLPDAMGRDHPDRADENGPGRRS